MSSRSAYWGGMIAGLAVGVGLFFLIETYEDTRPNDFIKAAAPALESVNITGYGAGKLARALNPCILDGPLPAGCEKFVKDGVVTQPPIKVILDESKIDK